MGGAEGLLFDVDDPPVTLSVRAYICMWQESLPFDGKDVSAYSVSILDFA